MNFPVEKKQPTFRGYFLNFQKAGQSKQSPNGEKTPNLVALIACNRFFVCPAKACFTQNKAYVECPDQTLSKLEGGKMPFWHFNDTRTTIAGTLIISQLYV
jgi:hypothetical protein